MELKYWMQLRTFECPTQNIIHGIEKGICQAVYCHPAYLTYIQWPQWEKQYLYLMLSVAHGVKANGYKYQADNINKRAGLRQEEVGRLG